MKFQIKIIILFLIILILFGCKKKENIQNDIVHDKNHFIENDICQEKNIESNVLFDNTSDLMESYIINPGIFFIYINTLLNNLRSIPNIDGEIVEVQESLYGFDAQEINIIEYTGIEERKDNIIYNWYKVSLSYSNNKEGYLRVETFVYDIDNNGIDDYFYLRYLPTNYYMHSFELKYYEIYIIINNERISNNIFEKIYLDNFNEYVVGGSEYDREEFVLKACIWTEGKFIEKKGKINLIITTYDWIKQHNKEAYIFEIDYNGDILLIK